jgi:hypothetical protein
MPHLALNLLAGRGVAIWVTCSSELVRTLFAYGTSPAAIAVITEY